MVTGVLFLMLVLLAGLLAAFIYQIATTPLTAVDAPTLLKSAAAAVVTGAPAMGAPAGPAPVPPAGLPHTATATELARRAPAPEEARGTQSWIAAVLAIAGLAALVIGGLLFLRIARGAVVCSAQAIEVCSQGFVLLTGIQLAGGAIVIAGIFSIIIAIVVALR